jgi:hypothetical protein
MIRIKKRVLALASLGASALSLLSCSLNGFDDSFGSGGFFGGSSGSSFVDASTTVPPSPCTTAVIGASCYTYSGASVCEIGDLANRSCNASIKCGNSYSWESDSNGTSCDVDCPAVYTEEVDGGACAAPNAATLQCAYIEGTCGCATPANIPSDAGITGDADAAGDAGSSDGGDAGPRILTWTCVKPAKGCPHVRPRLGSSCVRPIACDYGACVFDDGISVRCSGGFWVDDSRYCPSKH